MDIESEGTTVTVVHECESSTTDVIGLGDNSIQSLQIELENVSRITVNFAASGAVAHLAWNSVLRDLFMNLVAPCDVT
jgi:hypothetical protein